MRDGHHEFYYPEDGRIGNCELTGSYDHTVLLVGYTEVAWIIKNSWDTDWGDGGFGYLPFDRDCGLLEGGALIIETAQ